nr:reverse transcriptase domain-containing protein [Tanacetum cinerariifolium]
TVDILVRLFKANTFYNALNPADQDSLNAAAGGNLLERQTQNVLMIIENKSKVCNSRNKSVVSQVKSCNANSNSSSKIAKLTHAVNQQTSDVTTAMTAILKQFQATPPSDSVKVIEEICVTCGGAHLYYQCLAADGNTFLELRDNIQGYVSAATVNYNQGNSVYRLLGMANQIRSPGFAQPNVKNNQNRFGQPQGFNRGNYFNPEQSYQAPTQQNQIVPLNELEKVKRINEANIKAMQTQINIVKNELRNEMKNSIQASLSNQTNEIKNMMASLFQMNFAYTSGSESLPSNTVANPKGELKDITTQSGLVLDGPTVPTPHPFINPEEDERVEETLTDPDLSKYTIKVPPPPKMIKALLSNKEKLQELANTPLNENCSAFILKKLPEKLGDPGKFLILCGFNELKCKALADLGASINLMPLSVWKKLGLPELISTRMTLELANRAICTPAGIARDVFVLVGKFTFPPDFVIVDYESDPRVTLILGRPFLRTARALIDVHGEEMILRDGDEVLTLNIRHDTLSYSNQPQKESINLINVFNNSRRQFLPEKLLDLDSTKDLHPPLHVNPLSGSTTYSSSPNQLLEELALIIFPPKYDDDIQFDVEVDAKPSTNNEDKVFNPGILSQKKPFEIITRVVQDKKLAISNASLMLQDFDPPLYEPLFFKEVPRSNMLLPFSS